MIYIGRTDGGNFWKFGSIHDCFCIYGNALCSHYHECSAGPFKGTHFRANKILQCEWFERQTTVQIHCYQRPKTRQVGHAIATTRTAIKVRNVKFKKQGNRCVVGSADVILDLVYTYPRWNGSRRASAKLRSAWEKFNAQVVRHEQTHGRISREYARRLHSKLLTLSGRISNKCQDFGRRSQRALKLLLNGSRKRHISFDRREGRARSRVRRLQKALISTR